MSPERLLAFVKYIELRHSRFQASNSKQHVGPISISDNYLPPYEN